MTPTAAELLRGCAAALAAPPAEEDLALYLKGKLSLVLLLNLIAAQEAERGAAVRVVENADLRAALAQGEPIHPPPDDAPADPGDGDLSIPALDAANAALRLRLTALHVAAEAAGDAARDRAILKLYRRMAERRTLALPPMPA